MLIKSCTARCGRTPGSSLPARALLLSCAVTLDGSSHSASWGFRLMCKETQSGEGEDCWGQFGFTSGVCGGSSQEGCGGGGWELPFFFLPCAGGRRRRVRTRTRASSCIFMHFHAVVSTLGPAVPARRGWEAAPGWADPSRRQPALLLFKMELVPGSLEPKKTRYEFCKTALRR